MTATVETKTGLWATYVAFGLTIAALGFAVLALGFFVGWVEGVTIGAGITAIGLTLASGGGAAHFFSR